MKAHRSPARSLVPSRNLAIAVALCACALPLAAQPQRDPVFEAETTLLELEVRVTDRRGQPVPDLTIEDFEVLENGRPQTVATFEFVPRPAPLGPAAGTATVELPQSAEDPAAAASRSTFVYIATRGRRQDLQLLYGAVKEFIDNELAPGVFVSLQGAPFTSRRSELYERLEAMRTSSGASIDGLFDMLTVDLAEDIAYPDSFENLIEDANQEFTDALEEITNRQAFYDRLRMYEYIDLIRALSIYPGKKLVVLFSTGLRVEEENMDIMKVLEDEAMKARVRFFVSDVRRLEATAPGGDAEVSLGTSVDPASDGAVSRLFGSMEQRQTSQDGLWELARRTGGRAVVNSNDFGEVFEVAARESSDYYLIGYYPEDQEQRGRRRRLRVRVSDKSLRVSHQRGYYEERPFEQMSRSERDLRMHQALTFDTPYADLPIVVDHELFRDAGGNPTLVYSVGLHTGDIPVQTVSKGERVELTLIAQASARSAGGGRQTPVMDERRFSMTMDPAAMERLGNDPTSWLHYASQMPLPPGEYDWKVVVRDDQSGTLGSYQTLLRMPEPSTEIGASSLLLTSRIDAVGEPAPAKPGRRRAAPPPEDVLLVDGSRFFATAVKSFRRGDLVFLLYDIYNLSAADYDHPPAPRLALYSEGKAVGQLPVQSHQTVPQPEAHRVRHLAALATGDLKAGEYYLAAVLPAAQGKAGVIYRKFRIVDDSGQ